MAEGEIPVPPVTFELDNLYQSDCLSSPSSCYPITPSDLSELGFPSTPLFSSEFLSECNMDSGTGFHDLQQQQLLEEQLQRAGLTTRPCDVDSFPFFNPLSDGSPVSSPPTVESLGSPLSDDSVGNQSPSSFYGLTGVNGNSFPSDEELASLFCESTSQVDKIKREPLLASSSVNTQLRSRPKRGRDEGLLSVTTESKPAITKRRRNNTAGKKTNSETETEAGEALNFDQIIANEHFTGVQLPRDLLLKFNSTSDFDDFIGRLTSDRELTKEEKETVRKQRRQVKNRKNAQASRMRKLERITELETKVSDLSQDNHKLAEENRILREEMERLRQEMKKRSASSGTSHSSPLGQATRRHVNSQRGGSFKSGMLLLVIFLVSQTVLNFGLGTNIDMVGFGPGLGISSPMSVSRESPGRLSAALSSAFSTNWMGYTPDLWNIEPERDLSLPQESLSITSLPFRGGKSRALLGREIASPTSDVVSGGDHGRFNGSRILHGLHDNSAWSGMEADWDSRSRSRIHLEHSEDVDEDVTPLVAAWHRSTRPNSQIYAMAVSQESIDVVLQALDERRMTYSFEVLRMDEEEEGEEANLMSSSSSLASVDLGFATVSSGSAHMGMDFSGVRESEFLPLHMLEDDAALHLLFDFEGARA